MSIPTNSAADSIRKDIQQMLNKTEQTISKEKSRQRARERQSSDIINSMTKQSKSEDAKAAKQRATLPPPQGSKTSSNSTSNSNPSRQLSIISLLTEVIVLQVKMSSNFWQSLWKNTQSSMKAMFKAGQASATATKSALTAEANQLFAQAKGQFFGALAGAVAGMGLTVMDGSLSDIAGGEEDDFGSDLVTDSTKTPEEDVSKANGLLDDADKGAEAVDIPEEPDLDGLEDEAVQEKSQASLDKCRKAKQDLRNELKKAAAAKKQLAKGSEKIKAKEVTTSEQTKEDLKAAEKRADDKIKEIKGKIDKVHEKETEILDAASKKLGRNSSKLPKIKATDYETEEASLQSRIAKTIRKKVGGLTKPSKAAKASAKFVCGSLEKGAQTSMLLSPLIGYTYQVKAKEDKINQADSQAMAKQEDTNQQYNSQAFSKQEEVRQQTSGFISQIIQVLNEAVNTMSSTAQSLFRG